MLPAYYIEFARATVIFSLMFMQAIQVNHWRKYKKSNDIRENTTKQNRMVLIKQQQKNYIFASFSWFCGGEYR